MGSITQEVALEKVRFFSPIGYYEEERTLGNEYFVDEYVFFPFQNPDAEDLEITGNYEELFQFLNTIMKNERKLLEYAAEELLSGIRSRYPFVHEIHITIRHLTPPFGHYQVQTAVSLHYKS